MVAGLLYKFDLVLEHDKDNSCAGPTEGEAEKCSMVVYSVPWQDKTEVNWERSTCNKPDKSK